MLDPDADDPKLLAQVVAYYHETLTAASDAVDLLRDRWAVSREAVDHFRLGLSDRSLGTKLPGKETRAGAAIRSRLQALGVFRGSGHEHFRGSVTLPLFAADGSGRVADVFGTKLLPDRLRKGTPLDLHLNDGRRGVLNIGALGGNPEVVLCSSPWDALTFWGHGYRNVTAAFGADDLLAAFAEFRVSRVLAASETVVESLLAAGLEVFLLPLPPGETVAGYSRRSSDPADALGSLIRSAEWVGRGSRPAAEITSAEPTPPPVPDPDPEEDDDEPGEGDATPLATPTPLREASPLPPPAPVIEAEVGTDEVTVTFGPRRYRVRGFAKNLAFDAMRVNVMASSEHGMFIDTLDLYSAKHRRAFVAQAAEELGVEESTVKTDLGKVLLKLEELQDARLKEVETAAPIGPAMTDRERDDALALLRDPHLLDRIAGDFAVVGDRTNKLVGYLAAVSRKLDQPLAVLIQSTSAAGKTTLMEAVLDFCPPEDVVKYSAMTGQSLYYIGDGGLRHKVLAIVEEEGAARASFALKLLQSEGELRIASTGKEGSTGRLTTQEYHVAGPTMLFLTTTGITTDEELLNRCLVLTVEEDRDQTRAIHDLQRRRQTLDGLLAAQAHRKTLALHRNAQRLLRPLLVVNPHAERLTFPTTRTRTRRDHQKYLTLIRTVTLLHQYQRPVRTVEHQGEAVEFIESTAGDIAAVNELASVVLGRCLDDLSPQTRNLLGLIDSFVGDRCRAEGVDRGDFRFTRRQVREATGWGDTQLKVHLKRLVELEFVAVHRDRDTNRHAYELLLSCDGDRALPELIDVSRSGSEADRSGVGRGSVGPVPGVGRDRIADATPGPVGVNGTTAVIDPKS